MGDVTRVYARVWADGHCDAAANAPDELKAIVESELGGCVRLAPYVDKDRFAELLIGRGVAADIAHMIAQTAEITDDDAFFAPRHPR